jgi:hypothetical protein
MLNDLEELADLGGKKPASLRDDGPLAGHQRVAERRATSSTQGADVMTRRETLRDIRGRPR